MLTVPFLVGVAESGPTWVHLVLLVAWLSGYLLSYYAFLALKTRRPAKVRPQMVLYASIAAPAAVLALVARPPLLIFAPAFAALVAVNALYAWYRNERSMVNDVAAVAQACLMVPVAAVAGGASPSTGWSSALVLFLYFVGTAFYVKTMIRERGSVRWRRASVAFHAGAMVVAGLVALPLAVVFGWLLVRSITFPMHRLAPRTVGFVELGNSAVLLVMLPIVT